MRNADIETRAAFTFQELKAICEAKGWKYEIREGEYGTKFGFTLGTGTWNWFWHCAGEYMFDHAYSQLNGKTNKSWLRSFTVRTRLSTELSKLNK